MKKRQARKILNQVLQHDRPVNLPDGRQASKRAVRHAMRSKSDLLVGRTLQELKRMVALTRRFDSARRRQEQIFNRSFKRATRNGHPGSPDHELAKTRFLPNRQTKRAQSPQISGPV